jgi:hypothetical protein
MDSGAAWPRPQAHHLAELAERHAAAIGRVAAVQHVAQPRGPFTAGRALAAGLARVEVEEGADHVAE